MASDSESVDTPPLILATNSTEVPSTQKKLEQEYNNIQRGLMIMEEVTKTRAAGKKIDVQWNKKGQAIKSSKFISYIGVVAKTTVPITVKSWRKVDEATKALIWDTIASGFDIDESRQDFVLQKAGRALRSFRYFVTQKYLKDPDAEFVARVPPLLQPLVKQEDWDAFVASRHEKEFKELSTQNKERVAKNEYPYRAGRLGYAGIEQKQLEEEGSEVTISRHKLWALARTKKEGIIDNPRVKEVTEKIDSISQEVSQGNLPEDEDILARALGTTDHPGCVRGVGFGVTKK
ncbi:uncharacterized protein LOC129317413 [Prosopis cineraria]|uniref:uncharacterized protein LOC129317413 n=1 Tax=Prosopis cineraria TaxID=364024 RepID=UPI00240FF4D2|nr:uncharacterized protein LOC129317413 [Prosopis cineraria]